MKVNAAADRGSGVRQLQRNHAQEKHDRGSDQHSGLAFARRHSVSHDLTGDGLLEPHQQSRQDDAEGLNTTVDSVQPHQAVKIGRVG